MSTPLFEPASAIRPARRLTLGRWVTLCAIAEGIGMTAAAASARLTTALAPEPRGQAVLVGLMLVVAGGIVEGLAIGAAQAVGLRRMLPMLSLGRWILITTLVAGLGWAAASAPSALSPPGDAPTPSVALIAVLALGLGGVLGAVLAAAQAMTLRAIVRHPWRWIGVSALAWAPTMAIIFVGATTPEASWPDAAVVALGTLTGAVAGSVLALVSWPLLPLLDRSTITSELVRPH